MLGDFYTSGLYAWNSCALSAMVASATPMPAIYADAHFFLVANVESSCGDGVEASIDSDVAGNKVVVRPFEQQTYKNEEVRLTIFQCNEL